MAVIGIDECHFIVKDGTEASEYLLSWGLSRIEDEFGARFECADGSSVSFQEEAVAREIDGAPFRHLDKVIWGVDTQEALESLADELARDRKVHVDNHGVVHTVHNNDLSVGLRVTRRRPLDAKPILFNTPGAPTRIDQQATFYDRAVPQEISHIVLGVRDLASQEDFYHRRLGFFVSDRYVGRGVFLRGPSTGTHHNLFLLDDGKPSFNHLAFKVRDIHEVIGGGQGFEKTGAETVVGPGRHYASSGCFWYFKSPFGGAMEYVADEDVVTSAWVPGEHTPSPEKFSEWIFHSRGAMGALRKE